MKLTRVIAVGVIFGSVGLTALSAQTLREAQPPAEFPPASYKGKQYVDSKGCIYIRAGIDGNVTWVPRVTRDRKQVCGYKPTAVAGTTKAPAGQAAPTVITVAPEDRPGATQAKPQTQTATAKPKPATAPTATAPAPSTTQTATASPKPKTRTTTRTAAPSPTPATTTQPTNSRTATATTTTTVAPRPTNTAPTVTTAPVPQPSTSTATAANSGGCANASEFSQQFINKNARCGPQKEAPVTYGQGWSDSSAAVPSSSVPLTTRVVPRHVYDNRQNTTNVSVPKGYRTVWEDDRLNPHRAERTLKPSVVRGVITVPAGYKIVDWGDGRLNLKRGERTAQGDAQTDRIWSRTVPRTLAPVPTSGQIVVAPKQDVPYVDAAPHPAVIRLSTRSAPEAAGTAPASDPKAKSTSTRYVRVATFADRASAQTLAQSLARSGLPMRLGTVQRGGKAHSVVLAGPFDDKGRAQQALAQVKGAGYPNARLNKQR